MEQENQHDLSNAGCYVSTSMMFNDKQEIRMSLDNLPDQHLRMGNYGIVDPVMEEENKNYFKDRENKYPPLSERDLEFQNFVKNMAAANTARNSKS